MFKPFLDMTNAKSRGIASVGETLVKLTAFIKPVVKLAAVFALRTILWWLTATAVAYVVSWDVSRQDVWGFAVVVAGVITLEDIIKAIQIKRRSKSSLIRL